MGAEDSVWIGLLHSFANRCTLPELEGACDVCIELIIPCACEQHVLRFLRHGCDVGYATGRRNAQPHLQTLAVPSQCATAVSLRLLAAIW